MEREMILGLLVLLTPWVLFSILVGYYGARKGHGGITCFVGSLLLSPLLVAIIVALQGDNAEGLIHSGRLKKCPACAELVRADAQVCRFCHHEFHSATSAQLLATADAQPGRTRTNQIALAVLAIIAFAGIVAGTWWFADHRRARSTTVAAAAEFNPEDEAIGTLRAIARAQIEYMTAHPKTGYACSFGSLPPLTTKAAGEFDFSVNCPGVRRRASLEFLAVAKPKSASRYARTFCVDQSTIIRFTYAPAKCDSTAAPLM